MHQRQIPRAGLRTLALACMAAIAYVDPGNFAVNVAAGAEHGYTLVWVVVGASLTASLVQYLAAKLGIATGLSLAENCRTRYGRNLRLLLWAQAELVVIMTDLAELVGGAFALYLLLGIPMVWGAVIVATFGFVLLALRVRGYEG
ncbi:MAG TPA: Nramp family divalent metal transporter, partial [Microlunatus sp.]|nr:Nramp family divalent metal transporter [Microlunatus sp.]